MHVKTASNSTPVHANTSSTLTVPPLESEVEILKKQLKDSEMAISELKSMIEKLSLENAILKSRDSNSMSPEVQL